VYHTKSYYLDSLTERKKWLDCLVPYSRASVHDIYSIMEKIGTGRFSVVYRGIEKATKTEWAIKVIEKFKLKEEEKNFLAYETEMMRFLNHPGVIKVKETLENKTHIYIIAELVKDGDLFDYVSN